MSKTLRKIITLILVLTMLFGVSAVTISAVSTDAGASSSKNAGAEQNDTATGSGSSGDDGAGASGGTTGGSFTTGWFDVVYDTVANEITVTVTPDHCLVEAGSGNYHADCDVQVTAEF